MVLKLIVEAGTKPVGGTSVEPVTKFKIAIWQSDQIGQCLCIVILKR